MWRQLSRFPGHIVPQLQELGLEQEKTCWHGAGGWVGKEFLTFQQPAAAAPAVQLT